MAILLFLSFMILTGVSVYGMGVIVNVFSHLLPLSSIQQEIMQVFLLLITYYLMAIGLKKIILKLYVMMKMDFKTLSTTTELISSFLIVSLMFVHFYTLNYIYLNMSFSLEFIAIVCLTSFALSFSLKGSIDSSYQIKLSKEGDKFIYGDN